MPTQLLACPVTHQPLRPASAQLVAELNAEIARLALRDATATLIKVPLTGGLLRDDGLLLYPVRNGVAALFAGAGIAVRPPPPQQ